MVDWNELDLDGLINVQVKEEILCQTKEQDIYLSSEELRDFECSYHYCNNVAGNIKGLFVQYVK